MIELTRDECLELLGSAQVGRVAVGMGTGDERGVPTPVIRPVNYVFDARSQSIAFRTARGSKFHALLHANEAAFEVEAIDPERRAGWSVIVRGRVEEVTHPGELRRLDALGLEVWAPGERPHWVRIRARNVSGRRLAADVPGHADADLT